MLGRMRMSIAEAEKAYEELSKKLFTPVKGKHNPGRLYDLLQANGKFESEPLETHIKQKLQDKNTDKEELLKDTDPESCKVFVCAVRREDGSTAVIRSYKSRAADSLYDHCKIWEAARATSAASTFFEPISIGPWGQGFVDGASSMPIQSSLRILSLLSSGQTMTALSSTLVREVRLVALSKDTYWILQNV